MRKRREAAAKKVRDAAAERKRKQRSLQKDSLGLEEYRKKMREDKLYTEVRKVMKARKAESEAAAA